MCPEPECVWCTLKWVYERVIATQNMSRELSFSALKDLLNIFSNEFNHDKSPAKVANDAIHRFSDYLLSSKDYFDVIKTASNIAAKDLLCKASSFLDSITDDLQRIREASTIAMFGNVAPIGRPDGAFEFREVKEYLVGERRFEVKDNEIFNWFLEPKRILYVFDNAGEIGFDYLLIKELKRMGFFISVVVKDPYFFDDATLEDLRFFKIDEIVDEIHLFNGVFIPEDAEEDLQRSFWESELIISKGTGNYEALKEKYPTKTKMFMLKVKCDVLKRKSLVPVGEFLMELDPKKINTQQRPICTM